MAVREKITVIKWVSWFEAADMPQVLEGWGGGFDRGMRWDDYITDFPHRKHEYVNALRESILAKEIKEGGFWHQHSSQGAPVFSDGTAAVFSLRGWCDLLAAVWSTEEDKDYCYMDFYF